MVLCFGELLLRMSPTLEREWIVQHKMPVYIGGAELNVASALARWKVPVQYFTALPDNYLSSEITAEIASRGIHISNTRYSGERIGIYYLPQGADLRNKGVIYDRAHSSFAGLQPGEIDWDKVLKDCTWFHFSAISPALGQNIADVCLEGLKAASTRKLTISVDLNYRSKLWKYGKKPVEIMPELVNHCNVIMGNLWSAADLLGIEVEKDIHQQGSREAYILHAKRTAEHIIKKYPQCKTVANTFRFDAGAGIRYFATLDNQNGQVVSPVFETASVVDRVGSGDCFMGGLIYGLYSNHGSQDVIDFAAAAAFGKLQERGDATSQTVEDIKKILGKEWTGTKV